MTTQVAWDVMNKVVLPRAEKKGLQIGATIYSVKDWDNGVALDTSGGIVHVLGTGEIVDENNALKYE
jgi:hypothetical protein